MLKTTERPFANFDERKEHLELYKESQNAKQETSNKKGVHFQVKEDPEAKKAKIDDEQPEEKSETKEPEETIPEYYTCQLEHQNSGFLITYGIVAPYKMVVRVRLTSLLLRDDNDRKLKKEAKEKLKAQQSMTEPHYFGAMGPTRVSTERVFFKRTIGVYHGHYTSMSSGRGKILWSSFSGYVRKLMPLPVNLSHYSVYEEKLGFIRRGVYGIHNRYLEVDGANRQANRLNLFRLVEGRFVKTASGHAPVPLCARVV